MYSITNTNSNDVIYIYIYNSIHVIRFTFSETSKHILYTTSLYKGTLETSSVSNTAIFNTSTDITMKTNAPSYVSNTNSTFQFYVACIALTYITFKVCYLLCCIFRGGLEM